MSDDIDALRAEMAELTVRHRQHMAELRAQHAANQAVREASYREVCRSAAKAEADWLKVRMIAPFALGIGLFLAIVLPPLFFR